MSWDIEPQNITARIFGIDRRADWLLGDRRSEFRTGETEELLIPFIVRINTGNKSDSDLPLQIIGRLVEQDRIYIPSWYLTESIEADGRELKYPRSNQSFVAYAPLSFFDFLASATPDDKIDSEFDDINLLRIAEKSIELRTPLLRAQPARRAIVAQEESDKTRVEITTLDTPEPVETEWPEDTVIVAVIDDGIALANTRFQNLSGSRVEYFWRQDGPQVSSTVPTGRELTKSQIKTILASSSVGGFPDEDTFYSQAGLTSFTETNISNFGVNLRASHGAHVMDTATGFSKQDNVKNRPVIAVQLPAAVVEDTGGNEFDHHVYTAIDYILQRADHLSPGRTLPLVINLSFGTFSGPHDGTSELEKFLDSKVISRDKTRIILPAGNSRQSRTHCTINKSKFDIASQQKVELNWRVQPDDRTESNCHIWMPAETTANPLVTSRLSLSVVAPNGEQSAEINEVSSVGDLVYLVDGEVTCRVTYNFEAGDTNRGLFTLWLLPTVRNDNVNSAFPARVVAPSGVWKIILKDTGLAADTSVQGWIERDDTAYGYRVKGRQSYFDDPYYEIVDDGTMMPHRFDPNTDSTTKRAGTLNGIATGNETIIVGAMYRKEQTVTDYSACGPVTIAAGQPSPTRNGPDMLTIADDSRVHAGIAGAGTRSGSVVFLNGTSVAAPRVARAVADLLAVGGRADRTELAGIVIGQDLLSGTTVECSGSGRWNFSPSYIGPSRIDEESG